MNKNSKFKAGDKVETPFGVGIFDSYVDGGFMSGSLRVRYEKVRTGGVYFWNEDDIKPYKTPHERLLELGWVALNKANGVLTYLLNVDGSLHPERIELSLEGKSFYTTLRVIDLELAEILVEYLEELEK